MGLIDLSWRVLATDRLNFDLLDFNKKCFHDLIKLLCSTTAGCFRTRVSQSLVITISLKRKPPNSMASWTPRYHLSYLKVTELNKTSLSGLNPDVILKKKKCFPWFDNNWVGTVKMNEQEFQNSIYLEWTFPTGPVCPFWALSYVLQHL